MNSDGISAGIAPGREIAHGAEGDRDQRQQRDTALKPAMPRPDDDEHADEARRRSPSQRRQPTGSRKTTARAERDRQRQRLEDRRSVGERQMRDRRHERSSCRRSRRSPAAPTGFGSTACAADAARRCQAGECRDQHASRTAPRTSDHLAEVHLRRHRLGDGVVQREGRHGPGHQQAAADIGMSVQGAVRECGIKPLRAAAPRLTRRDACSPAGARGRRRRGRTGR